MCRACAIRERLSRYLQTVLAKERHEVQWIGSVDLAYDRQPVVVPALRVGVLVATFA